MSRFAHRSVLLAEAVDGLRPRSGGVYVDGTLGGAGHSREILERSAPDGKLIGIDQDEIAIANATESLQGFGARVTLVRANFRSLRDVLDRLAVHTVDGVLFDLGVSSPQLDEEERGFSYRFDAPLDMRMNRDEGLTASDIVNEWSKEAISGILRDYAEERWAARIAEFIVNERKQGPIHTTGQLVDLIKAAVPKGARRDGPHPARRTFQALRIAVNDELGALRDGLQAGFDALAVHGRLVVITFHSLEDRIVKQAFASWCRACVCPPEQIICTCGGIQEAQLIYRKPLAPSEEEVAANPRARSAKLRVIERIGHPQPVPDRN